MKIIEPSAQILNPRNREEGVACLRKIEALARISHRSENAQTENSWEKFIKAVVISHGDWSVVEHAYTTVIFRVDRAICMEIVRHRLASYTMESTRFCNYSKKDLDFIAPLGYNEESELWKKWKTSLAQSELNYLFLLEKGQRPQEARSVLPNSTAATLAMTTNLRNLRHFLLMRTSKETHPELRRVTVPLLKEIQQNIPLLFDDIEPNERQIENLKKPR